jgi:hypothetical protein
MIQSANDQSFLLVLITVCLGACFVWASKMEEVLASVLDRRQERTERRRKHIAELNKRATEAGRSGESRSWSVAPAVCRRWSSPRLQSFELQPLEANRTTVIPIMLIAKFFIPSSFAAGRDQPSGFSNSNDLR